MAPPVAIHLAVEHRRLVPVATRLAVEIRLVVPEAEIHLVVVPEVERHRSAAVAGDGAVASGLLI